MYLKLAHTRLEIYSVIRRFTLECYRISSQLPADEKFNMMSQLRRASLSVHLNFAEGSSKTSAIERKRFYEISRSSLIEIDAIIEIANELGYLPPPVTAHAGELMINVFRMLSGLIKSTK